MFTGKSKSNLKKLLTEKKLQNRLQKLQNRLQLHFMHIKLCRNEGKDGKKEMD